MIEQIILRRAKCYTCSTFWVTIFKIWINKMQDLMSGLDIWISTKGNMPVLESPMALLERHVWMISQHPWCLVDSKGTTFASTATPWCMNCEIDDGMSCRWKWPHRVLYNNVPWMSIQGRTKKMDRVYSLLTEISQTNGTNLVVERYSRIGIIRTIFVST